MPRKNGLAAPSNACATISPNAALPSARPSWLRSSQPTPSNPRRLGLALAVSSASALPAATATSAATKAIIMTTLKKTLIAIAALLLFGTATVAVFKKAAKPVSNNKAVAVILDNFVGRFEMTGHRLDLQKKDAGLAVFIDGQPALSCTPQSEDKFVSQDHNSTTEMTFVKDSTGHAVQL